MKISILKKLVVIVMVVLLVLPIISCVSTEPPLPTSAPPAGTFAISPPAVDQATLKAVLPALAKSMGLPEVAVQTLPPHLGLLGLPIKFSGSDWQANEVVSIELVVPPDVDMPGLKSGEDSVGIAFAKVGEDGNFEITMDPTSKLNWLLRTEWTPIFKPDMDSLDPIPNGTYTVKAVGTDPRTVTTTTWRLEMLRTP